MLGEIKCKQCQTNFLVGLRHLNPELPVKQLPIKHCVCCGSEDLEFLGTEEDLAVRIKRVIDQYNILQAVR